MNKLRIGFLTPWEVTNPASWSGVISPMIKSLSSAFTVVPLSTAGAPTSTIDRLAARAVGTLTSKKYLWDHAVQTSRSHSQYAEKLIREAKVDAVLAVSASTEIAFVSDLGIPIVQVADSTFALMENYYPQFTDVHPLSRHQASTIAHKSSQNTSLFAMPSSWVIDSLTRDYGVEEDQCFLVPFGAVVTPDKPPLRTPSPRLKVLLVSSNWERKNGDGTVLVIERLRNEGHPIDLTVVGKSPAHLPPWVNQRGVLTKEELSDVYASSDVLIELASANCSGVTLTDASAFGLPAVSTNVGGIASIVIDGETGILVSAESSQLMQEQASAALIRLLVPEVRQQMSKKSLLHHAQTLNWNAWAHGVENVLHTAIGRASVPHW